MADTGSDSSHGRQWAKLSADKLIAKQRREIAELQFLLADRDGLLPSIVTGAIACRDALIAGFPLHGKAKRTLGTALRTPCVRAVLEHHADLS